MCLLQARKEDKDQQGHVVTLAVQVRVETSVQLELPDLKDSLVVLVQPVREAVIILCLFLLLNHAYCVYHHRYCHIGRGAFTCVGWQV